MQRPGQKRNPKWKRPGPPKKFIRYFTVPVTEGFLAALENMKWRIRLNKAEICRRFIEYLLTLPPATQDQILKAGGDTPADRPPRRRRDKIEVSGEAAKDRPNYSGVLSSKVPNPKAPQTRVVPRVKKSLDDGLP